MSPVANMVDSGATTHINYVLTVQRLCYLKWQEPKEE
jgi:hypothetical protein